MNKLREIEYGNQRVLTTAQLAEFYGTDTVRISQNYIRNMDKYQIGVHNFKIEGDYLKAFKADYQIYIPSNINSLMLWTEKGTFLHAKSLNTDKAWEVYGELVDTYFKIKELNPYITLSKELKAIFITDQKVQAVESRISKLENTMTIDYSQQEEIRHTVSVKAMSVLGVYDAPAYKEIGRKAWNEIYRELKRVFRVNSYRNISVKDYGNALIEISCWEPTRELELMIIGANTGVV